MEYVERIQKASPAIYFGCECYHYETYQVTTTDSNGNTSTRTETRRVVTHTARMQYDVQGFIDETLSAVQTIAMFHLLHDGDLDVGDAELGNGVKKMAASKLFLQCHFPLEFHPASRQCELDFTETRAKFYSANNRDTHQDRSESHSCADHWEYTLVVLTGGTDSSTARPWWMQYSVFAFCSIFMMSIPYRLYLFRRCQKVEWPVMKHFSPRPVSEWESEVPEKSRQHRSDPASKAFRAVPREFSGGGTGGVVQADNIGAASENYEELDLTLAAPTYWKNQDLNCAFDDQVRVKSEELEIFQRFVDQTYIQKATRDRRDGPMPSGLKVTHVMRMEDSKLWSRYLEKRSELAKRPRPRLIRQLPGSGAIKTTACCENGPFHLPAPALNEVYLFHGSSPAGALGIGNDGFNMSKVGSNVGTMFGGGAYFAEASSKSDEYANTDPGGVFAGKYAFLLCRVLVGNAFYITQSDIPAIEEALATGSYDAVLGDREAAVGTYREIVVFDESQIYPEYVVVYERIW